MKKITSVNLEFKRNTDGNYDVYYNKVKIDEIRKHKSWFISNELCGGFKSLKNLKKWLSKDEKIIEICKTIAVVEKNIR